MWLAWLDMDVGLGVLGLLNWLLGEMGRAYLTVLRGGLMLGLLWGLLLTWAASKD